MSDLTFVPLKETETAAELQSITSGDEPDENIFDDEERIPVESHGAKAQTRFVQSIIGMTALFHVMESLAVAMMIALPTTYGFIHENYGLFIGASFGLLISMGIVAAFGLRLWRITVLFMQLFHALCVGFLVGSIAVVSRPWVVGVFCALTVFTHMLMFICAMVWNSNLLTRKIYWVNLACIAFATIAMIINRSEDVLWILAAAVGSALYHIYLVYNIPIVLSRCHLSNWIGGAYMLSADLFHALAALIGM